LFLKKLKDIIWCQYEQSSGCMSCNCINFRNSYRLSPIINDFSRKFTTLDISTQAGDTLLITFTIHLEYANSISSTTGYFDFSFKIDGITVPTDGRLNLKLPIPTTSFTYEKDITYRYIVTGLIAGDHNISIRCYSASVTTSNALNNLLSVIIL